MFLSISLDLVGSTALKRAMFQSGEENFTTINRLYERFFGQFFDIEESFYRHVCASGVIDIRKLFLVKIIGDEYWYAYEVEDEAEIEGAGRALVAGLLELLGEPRTVAFGGAKENDFRFDLSLKVLIDLVTNALNLPDRRYAHFQEKIMDLLDREARLPDIDPGDYAALCHGLNLRPARPETQELLGVTRSDYVGMQIDRFFRAARACKPRLVTVGGTLWDRFDIDLGQVHPRVGVYRTRCSAGGGPVFARECLASRESIPAREMTGIDHDYDVWHLYCRETLREDIYLPDHNLTDFLAPTRAFLAREGFYGVERHGGSEPA